MKAVFFLLLGMLATLSMAASPRTVTDMAGRTVTLPETIGKVLAPGHCASLVGAFAAEKISGGLVRGKDAQALVPEAWWNTDTMQRGPSGPPPGAGGPPSGPQGAKGMKPAKGGPGGPPGNDSARLARMKEMMFKDHITLLFQEMRSPRSAAEADSLQKMTGVPVVLLELDIPRYREAFELLGTIFEKPERTKALTDFATRYLDPIAAKVKTIPTSKRVRVYYAEGLDGLRTEPAGSAHTEALEFAGAINVMGAPAGNSMDQPVEVTVRQVDSLAPSLILVATPGSENLTAYSHILLDSSWQSVPAVKKKQVYQIPAKPFSWFDRPPGANRMIGIVWIAHLLYPDQFPYDMVQVTREFFRAFYEADISEAQAKALLEVQPSPRPAKNRAKPGKY